MGFYARYIFPCLMDCSLNTELVREQRRQSLEQAAGTVLEIGFGTGLNLAQYPPGVHTIIATDVTTMRPRTVVRRMREAAVPVRRVYAAGEALPFQAGSFDCVVSTLTLCTLGQPVVALREVHRVLKPGGQFLFLEHGRSDERRVARWQDRLNPLQQWIACGCHITRRIDQLIEQAGLRIASLSRYTLRGAPRIWASMYRGVARVPCP